MQRHPALQPLSRDHHDVLVVARTLNKSVQDQATQRSALRSFVTLWNDELRSHLELEERWLTPHLSDDLRRRMTSDHTRIREMSADVVNLVSSDLEPPTEFVAELADVLRNHVRWEEREVFESLQATLSTQELEDLAKITGPLDVARRSRHA